MENPVGKYAEYLKPCDIQEATQYSTPVIYQMIREMELIPGLVVRRKSGRGIRVHRDKFFLWFATRENMKHIPEYLKNA